MRQRVISSIGVVIIGLAAIIFGGPIFAAGMIALGVGGGFELDRMLRQATPLRLITPLVAMIIASLGVFAWLAAPGSILLLVSFVTIGVALISAMREPSRTEVMLGAVVSAVSALYMAIPVVAAIALRQQAGPAAGWVGSLNRPGAELGHSTAAGLAWLLYVVMIIWVSDSAAYLGGRALGRRQLAPRISPNKTVEGAAFGLCGAVLTGVLINGLTGLNLPILVAASGGAVIAGAGMLGDLTESLVKRQLGAKDSGTLIPGHGGILDRIDALLMALPVAWLLAILVAEARP